jgi:uncharacterized protein (UPF0335 family)
MAKGRRNMNISQELRTAADNIIALEIEKKEVGDSIKEIYEALDEKGFDTAAVKLAVKRRKKSASQRARDREVHAIADVYSAAMGDLFGKPLDDYTRQRMQEERDRLQGKGQGAESEQAGQERQGEALPGTTAPEPITAEAIDAAREEGRQARRADPPLRIVDNPHHSADPRRAAWDEGWCEADGSDGMEIPAAWRRKDEEKKENGENKDNKTNNEEQNGGPGGAGGTGDDTTKVES